MADAANQSSVDGITVVITRPLRQADTIARQLKQLGAIPIVFPCIEIVAIDCAGELAALPVELDRIDMFIFISSNAVQHAFAQFPQLLRQDAPNKTFAATGQSTAQTLRECGIAHVLVPDQGFDSESLLSLRAMHSMQGKFVLIVKGFGGRTELYDTLTARGANVYTLDVYQRLIPANADLSTLHPAPDAILFSSSESVENMLKIIPAHEHKHVLPSQTVAGHPRIAAKVASLGFEKLPIIAANPSDQAMLTALVDWANRTENHNERPGRNGT